MSELAGFKLNENLIKEATNKIDGNDGIVILISDFVKNHIMTHNKVGAGSIFKSGVNEAEIIKMVTQVAPKVSGDGGAYELNQSGIGYDLVLPMEAAKKLPDAVEGTVEKQEGQNKVTVPSISTSQPIQKFVTNRISLIIRKSNPQFLPDDVKADENVLGKIKEGKCYSLLTAFPGNPDIPKSSEWGGKFAVILPGQKPQGNAKPEQQAQNQPVSENKKTRKITLNELRKLVMQVLNENHYGDYDELDSLSEEQLYERRNELKKELKNLFKEAFRLIREKDPAYAELLRKQTLNHSGSLDSDTIVRALDDDEFFHDEQTEINSLIDEIASVERELEMVQNKMNDLGPKFHQKWRDI